MTFFGELQDKWWIICIGLGIAFVLGFVWLLVLRKFAGVFVWVSIIVSLLGLYASTFIVYGQYVKYNDIVVAQTETYGKAIDSDQRNRDFCYGVLIFLGVLSILMTLIVIFMWTRIKIAIGLIKEGSRALIDMPQCVLLPIPTFIALVAVLAFYVAIALALATVGKPDYLIDETGASPPLYNGFKMDDDIRRLQWYHLFGCLWVMNMVLAINQYAVAGAVTRWYFTRNKADVSRPVIGSLWQALRYHAGSLAFGALILALVQVVRIWLAWLDKQSKKTGLLDNPVFKALFRCLQCCLSCFERFLRFLNKNAYIVMAAKGTNFCTSARNAFNLLLANVLRVAAVNGIGGFVMFLGKIFITMFSVGISMLILRVTDDAESFSISAPLVVIAIGSYIVCSAFLSIHDVAVDTILMDFLLDLDMNNGKDKPYFMSAELKSIMGAVEKAAPKDSAGDDKKPADSKKSAEH